MLADQEPNIFDALEGGSELPALPLRSPLAADATHTANFWPTCVLEPLDEIEASVAQYNSLAGKKLIPVRRCESEEARRLMAVGMDRSAAEIECP